MTGLDTPDQVFPPFAQFPVDVGVREPFQCLVSERPRDGNILAQEFRHHIQKTEGKFIDGIIGSAYTARLTTQESFVPAVFTGLSGLWGC